MFRGLMAFQQYFTSITIVDPQSLYPVNPTSSSENGGFQGYTVRCANVYGLLILNSVKKIDNYVIYHFMLRRYINL